MQEIKGFDLAGIYDDAIVVQESERRREAQAKIVQMLDDYARIVRELAKIKQELDAKIDGKERELGVLNALFNRIREGDWSAVSDKVEESKK